MTKDLATIVSVFAIFVSVAAIYMSVRAAIAVYHLSKLPEETPQQLLEPPTITVPFKTYVLREKN